MFREHDVVLENLRAVLLHFRTLFFKVTAAFVVMFLLWFVPQTKGTRVTVLHGLMNLICT